MSFLKLVRLAKKFEQKLLKEGQGAVRQMTGPGEYKDIDLSQVAVPAAQVDSNIPPPPPEREGSTLQVPEVTIKGTPPNPNVKSVQKFLNQEASKSGAPQVAVDGVMGNATRSALALWGKANKLNLNPNQLYQVALTRAMGSGIVGDLSKNPALK
jgi:hypothetical protein